MIRHLVLALFAVMVGGGLAAAETPVVNAPKPSILIVNGTVCVPFRYGDFDYFQRLHQHGFQIDTHFLDEQPPRPQEVPPASLRSANRRTDLRPALRPRSPAQRARLVVQGSQEHQAAGLGKHPKQAGHGLNLGQGHS